MALLGLHTVSLKKITSQSASTNFLVKAAALPLRIPVVQPALDAPEYGSVAPVHWAFWYKSKLQSTLARAFTTARLSALSSWAGAARVVVEKAARAKIEKETKAFFMIAIEVRA